MSRRILLAEDEPVLARLIQDVLQDRGYQVTLFEDGASAWDHLADQHDYDVILLDWSMPGMDGIDLLRKIKAEPDLARIPIIMETANSDDDSIRQGLQEGAYYYLVKPFQPETLEAIVDAALAQRQEMEQLINSVQMAEKPLLLMQSGRFSLRTLDDARLLANYLSLASDQSERIIQGLQDLLVNAIEHGNLEIGYTDKGRLIREGQWQQEIERRLALPEYQDRSVEVDFHRDSESINFTIQDQGRGFEWRKYLDFEPERAFDLHGRGIAMARKLSFDQLEFSESGNRVTARVFIKQAG